MADLLASPSGSDCTLRKYAFLSSPKQRGARRIICQSQQVTGSLKQAVLERREILLSGLSAGVFSSMLPQIAHAESVCSNFTTANNGIQWCETKEGSGKTPSKGQLIRCHYTGRLTSNGQVFDSSYERRRPLSFKVGAREVIQGWDKAILGEDDLPAMKEGGKRRVIIPAALAYGSRGAGGVIPPNAVLTFDIELLGKR